jgi:hypothetical protein
VFLNGWLVTSSRVLADQMLAQRFFTKGAYRLFFSHKAQFIAVQYGFASSTIAILSFTLHTFQLFH